MIINENTQLGLGYQSDFYELLQALKSVIDVEGDIWGATGGKVKEESPGMLRQMLAEDSGLDEGLIHLTDGDILRAKVCGKVFGNPIGADLYLKSDPGYCYLITKTVEDCADMVRIGENFSTSILNKLKSGWSTILLGRNEFYKVIKRNDCIAGFYWNKTRGIAFEFGFDLKEERYYFPSTQKADFDRIVRILTFILLGDIETFYLAPGRSNNKPKKDGKITNTSKFPVSIVDSKWNKIVIRTEGFGVRGHFRLQPTGAARSDRKLIWINAFEKHGYKRNAGILR